MRRDSNDLKWKEVKNKVRSRDKNSCRLLRLLSMREYCIFSKNASRLKDIIDPAHFKAVSERPDLCYDENNIVCLNRYSHEMLDSCKDPLNGNPITKKERDSWWLRILEGNKDQYKYLKDKGLIGED